MKHKTADLTGALLDAAVALADGRLVVADEPGWTAGEYKRMRAEYDGRHVVRWYGTAGDLGGWEPIDNQGSPSTDWSLGGPIIERERIDIYADSAELGSGWYAEPGAVEGPTPLIAAMRAYVATKLGYEVDLP